MIGAAFQQPSNPSDLRGITDHCGRRMSVDVIDLSGGDPGIVESQGHRRGHVGPVLPGNDDMERLAGGAVTGDFGINPRAALFRMGQRF